MRGILFFVLLFWGGTSFGSAVRTVDADALRSSSTATTLTLPAVTGNVMSSVGLLYEIPTGTINGTNTSFTLANTPSVTASLHLLLDGIVLIPTTDYSISGSTITFVTAPALGQFLRATYSKY
jgi:hypothetical protein